jgi:hypothetical protein
MYFVGLINHEKFSVQFQLLVIFEFSENFTLSRLTFMRIGMLTFSMKIFIHN